MILLMRGIMTDEEDPNSTIDEEDPNLMTDEKALNFLRNGHIEEAYIVLKSLHHEWLLHKAHTFFDRYKMPFDSFETPRHLAEDTWWQFITAATRVYAKGETVENVRGLLTRLLWRQGGNILKRRRGISVPLSEDMAAEGDVDENILQEEDDVETMADLVMVLKSLMFLPDLTMNQRLAVFGRDYKGMSAKEIGEMLHMKPNSVHTIISQARAKVRKYIDANREFFWCETPDECRAAGKCLHP